jgi:hypothetical protein
MKTRLVSKIAMVLGSDCAGNIEDLGTMKDVAGSETAAK